MFLKLRGKDLNQRPPGYEPDELPDCSTPRYIKLICEGILAEEVGFEPTHARTSAGFQDQSLQPLGYSSIGVGGPCRTRTYDQPVMSRPL